MASLLSVLLCVTMLIGTTFAWFTDSVTSGGNIIKSGTLDVEMYYKDLNDTDWSTVETGNTDPKFFIDAQGNDILWEPGVMSYAQFKIANVGTLALKYNFVMNSTHNELETSGVKHNLEEVIKVKVLEGSVAPTRSDIEGYDGWGDFASFADSGYLLPKGQTGAEKEFTVVLYWAPTGSDNLYNAHNGGFVSDYDANQDNNYLWINASLKLIATQYTYEDDSFDENYDRFATYTQSEDSATVPINNTTESFVAISVAPAPLFGDTEVTFPAASFDTNAHELKVTAQVDSLGVAANVTGFQVNSDSQLASATVTLTATVDGTAVTSFNDQYVTVETYISKGLHNVTVTYNGEGEAPKNVQYDPVTGLLSFETNHFSEWTVWCELNPAAAEVKDYVYDDPTKTVTVNTPAGLAWVARMVNTNDETWNWFGGMTVKLGADIDLAGALWVPIGNASTFDGNFDGAGHTVKNMRMNVYEQEEDYVGVDKATIKRCFGLFGYATGGTIKNLTVDSAWVFSEGKPIGAVAGVASGGTTFENITVKNCTLNGYQNGTGGVVGNAYNMGEGGNTELILRNITVDETNVFTTNYRSPDTLIGGLIGQVYPSWNGTMTTVISNCTVSAKIMALNDVVANYQYYRYRNSGMLIGTLRDIDMDAEGFNPLNYIHIDNVNVIYDTWNQQRYCEFHEASHPSYSGEGDWKFFRIDEDDNGNHAATYVREAGTVVVADMNQHYHYEDETHDVLLVFDQLIGAGTGGTCVRTIEGVNVTYLNGSEPQND